jgi:peroxiredoxin
VSTDTTTEAPATTTSTNGGDPAAPSDAPAGQPAIEPVVARDGWGVLHLFHRIDRTAARELSRTAVEDLVATLEQAAGTTQLHLFSVLGHKADIMTMVVDEDWTRLRAVQTAIDGCAAASALRLDWSYLSITEGSEYTTTPEQYREQMAPKVEDPERLDRMVQEYAQRMATYTENKVHPRMPEWELACFYPMSHRREGEDNWYSLDFDRRKELMGEHGRSGRAYTGRVLQLVSGSTGLDDWEWGVTLFAHDMFDVKDIVYRLRYDEASARFAEFGPFVIGMRRTPRQLVHELGLARDA